MSFEPSVNVTKSGDRLTVMVKQKYYPRAETPCKLCREFRNKLKPSYRWRIAGTFSLKELEKNEANL